MRGAAYIAHDRLRGGTRREVRRTPPRPGGDEELHDAVAWSVPGRACRYAEVYAAVRKGARSPRQETPEAPRPGLSDTGSSSAPRQGSWRDLGNGNTLWH